MKNCKIGVLFGVFFLASVADAYVPREGNITVNLGPFFSKTSSSDPRSTFDASTSSFGLVTVGDINTRGALEISLFHMHKSFFRHDGPYSVFEKTELLHISMGYRWWLSQSWSSSMAFSSSYTMGTPTVLYNDFPPSPEPFPTSATDTVEYGVDFALQRELWSRGEFGVVLDLRYNLSLTSKTHEQGDHYGALLSVRYLAQEKYPSDLKKEHRSPKN